MSTAVRAASKQYIGSHIYSILLTDKRQASKSNIAQATIILSCFSVLFVLFIYTTIYGE